MKFRGLRAILYAALLSGALQTQGNVMEIFATVVSGSLVLVLGLLASKLVAEPIIEFKRLLGRISEYCLLNQNEICGGTGSEKTRFEAQRLASELLAARQAIPWYRQTSFVFRLPKQRQVLHGAHCLNQIGYLTLPESEDRPQGIKRDQLHEADKVLRELGRALGVVTSFIPEDQTPD